MRLSGLAYYARSVINLLINVTPRSKIVPLFLGRAGSSPLIIRLRPSGLQFHVRTAMDVWVIKETCLDRDYENPRNRVSSTLQDNWTIIDIGAGLGDFTAYAAQRSPQGRVLAYEPFPESFALLQQNVALNKLRNVEARPCAIAAQPGALALNIGLGEAVQHSTTQAGARTIEVQAITLQQVFDKHGLERCDFLKMDIEGGEYAILQGIDASLLKRVQRIALEYHDNTSDGRHDELVRLLQRNGFQVQVRPNPVHDYLGYLYAMRD
ncbi:MAG TPA: FkbM family methyltransferase [Anaerolineae bacterium]|nr:FkbM family methyltransferase [Anaerolineae bacterium]